MTMSRSKTALRTGRGIARLAEFKALDAGAGTFTALVSVFGNVDLGGDRVVKGAFASSIEEWRASGDPIPVIWSHQWNDPHAHIGYVDPADIEETDAGLLVTKGVLDIDKPLAKQVYDLLAERRVKEFSFAYDVFDEKRGNDGANELLELGIIEVGPTLKGMNPATQLVDVKSASEAGRKAVVTLDGSLEQQRGKVLDAVKEWASSLIGDIYYVDLEATFADHTVAYVETWDEPYGGGTYYAIPYSVSEAGVELDVENINAVDIVGTVVAKATHARLKALGVKEGRRNAAADVDRIQGAHDLLVELGAACAEADGESATSTASAEEDVDAAKTGGADGVKTDAGLRGALDELELDVIELL